MKKLFLFVMAAMCCAMTVSAIEGALPGVFTINGVKVQFSKGNLQYQASTNTWRFAEHQWDIIGEGNENISPTYDGWIDLFGWGTSGYNNHYPYMTTTDDTQYGEKGVDITNTNYDWGVYNPISNGGNKAGLWRTIGLDISLWYLLRDGHNVSERWALGRVNGVNGLILIPDEWSLPSGAHFVSAKEKFFYEQHSWWYFMGKGVDNHFEDNIYSIAEWEDMEDAGAVFLPVTGYREEKKYVNEFYDYKEEKPLSDRGLYWTSESIKFKKDYSSCIMGNLIGFQSDCCDPGHMFDPKSFDEFVESMAYIQDGMTNYHFGFAVRLVTPYKEGEQDSYRVKITQPEHGTIIVKETDVDLDAVKPNTVLHFIATPDEGYLFDAWSGCKSDGSLTVTNNVTVTCTFSKIPEEKKLSGQFTVNAEGKQVIFSSGNLQFNAKQGIWQFAENQYDIIGDDNANISATYGGWIDLFGWGTSGYNSRNPWMTSEDNAQYGDGAKDIAGTDYDWGQYCAINNGGQKAGRWQTLTFDEWMYIIDNRTDAKLHRGQAAVAEVEGFVLLPDDWTLPTGASFSSTEKNTYTAEQWKTMEDAGAVFLPCGGFRKETAITYPNAVGVYWSASNYTDEAGKAQSVYISGKYIMENFNDRSQGLSVRLVRDAINTYTVRFTDKDDAELKSLPVKQGEQVNAADIPDASALTWDCHAFDGWQSLLTGDVMTAEQIAAAKVTADVTYQAHYKTLTYKLTLSCEHGTINITESVDPDAVPCGTTLHFSVTPDEGYEFDQWLFEYDDEAGYEVTADATIAAQTKILTFTVTFVNYNGETLKTETVNWNESATAPADPKREGFNFTGWDKAFDHVTADLTVTAQYEEIPIVYYTVTFLDWDGTFLFSEKVEEGRDAKGTEVTPTREGYTFTGWSKPITNITADLTVIALYEEVKVYYTVTFLDWDGTFLFSEKVEEGHDAKGTEVTPTREGYTFTGWSKPITNITADLTVIAQYKKEHGTDIDNVDQPMLVGQKLLRDGRLYIIVGDRIYDATGKKVQ